MTQPVTYLEMWRRAHNMSRMDLAQESGARYHQIARLERGLTCHNDDARRIEQIIGVPMRCLSSAIYPAVNLSFFTKYNQGVK
jgi:ribosome-binding protein aMBF1 (putative translation factor)